MAITPRDTNVLARKKKAPDGDINLNSFFLKEKKGLELKPLFMGLPQLLVCRDRLLSCLQPFYDILPPIDYFLAYPGAPWPFAETIKVCEIPWRNQ